MPELQLCPSLSLPSPFSLSLLPCVEQKATSGGQRVIFSLVKRGWKPFGVLWKGGFEPPLRVKPRFQGERARLVPRVQLTINAMLAVIHSGNEWVRCRVAKLTNFIEPKIYTHWQQVYACASSAGTKLHYDRAAARPKNPHSSIMSRSLFRRFGHAMRFDWTRLDTRFDKNRKKLADYRYRICISRL